MAEGVLVGKRYKMNKVMEGMRNIDSGDILLVIASILLVGGVINIVLLLRIVMFQCKCP